VERGAEYQQEGVLLTLPYKYNQKETFTEGKESDSISIIISNFAIQYIQT
jgi:hypothetical protein